MDDDSGGGGGGASLRTPVAWADNSAHDQNHIYQEQAHYSNFSSTIAHSVANLLVAHQNKEPNSIETSSSFADQVVNSIVNDNNTIANQHHQLITTTSTSASGNDNNLEGEFFTTFDLLVVGLLIAIILISIVGNCLVCIAIFTDRRLRKLGNAFIVSLAIADLFVSCLVMTFALCNDLMKHWIFGDWFCDVWISFDIMCCTASILNLCAISLDRFIHIKDCLLYNQWMTRKVAISAVIIIWFISALVSFVPINLGWHKPDHFTTSGSGSLSSLSSHSNLNANSIPPQSLLLLSPPSQARGPLDSIHPITAALHAYEPASPTINNHLRGNNNLTRQQDRGPLNKRSVNEQQQVNNINQQQHQHRPTTTKSKLNYSNDNNNNNNNSKTPTSAPAPAEAEAGARPRSMKISESGKLSQQTNLEEPIENQSSPFLPPFAHKEQAESEEETEDDNVAKKGTAMTETTRKISTQQAGQRQLLSTKIRNKEEEKPPNSFVNSKRESLNNLSESAAATGRRNSFSGSSFAPQSFRASPDAGSSSGQQHNYRDRSEEAGGNRGLRGGKEDEEEASSSLVDEKEKELEEKELFDKKKQVKANKSSLSKRKRRRRSAPLQQFNQVEFNPRDGSNGIEEDDEQQQQGANIGATNSMVSHQQQHRAEAQQKATSHNGGGGYSTTTAASSSIGAGMQCALNLTPTYAIISSTISFYIPCIIMIGLYTKLFACARKHVKNIQAISKAPAPISLAYSTTTNSIEQQAQQRLTTHSRQGAQVALAGAADDNNHDDNNNTGQSNSVNPLKRTWLKFGNNFKTKISQQTNKNGQYDKNIKNNAQSQDQQQTQQLADSTVQVGQSGGAQSHPRSTGAEDNSINKTTASAGSGPGVSQAQQQLQQPLMNAIVFSGSNSNSITEEGRLEGVHEGASRPQSDGKEESEPFLAGSKGPSEKGFAASTSAKSLSRNNNQLITSGGLYQAGSITAAGHQSSLAKANNNNNNNNATNLVKQSNLNISSAISSQQQHQQSRQLATHKAAITLGIIMGTFLFCWVPFFCLNIIKAFYPDNIEGSIFRAFTWLGYANSALNPIIYGIHNSEFRNAFNRIFFKHLNFKNSRYYQNRRFSYDLRRNNTLQQQQHSNNSYRLTATVPVSASSALINQASRQQKSQQH